MSGHSKWSKIKRQKGAKDAKRSNLFTKLSKNISVAARDGVDPTMNFRLRMAIDKARSFSMPKDSIERAIAKGGGDDGATLSTVLYEGFGPDGVALIIQVVTDNKNRTVSEIKHAFSKNGGNLGGSGSVAWMFDIRGVITIKEPKLSEDQELVLIDSGLIDVQPDESGATLIVEFDQLQKATEAVTEQGLTVEEATAAYIPKESITPENEEKIIQLLDALDDLDDVDNVYTNANV